MYHIKCKRKTKWNISYCWNRQQVYTEWRTADIHVYCMVGNFHYFHGWLGSHKNFHRQNLMPAVILYMQQVDRWWAWPKTLWQHGQPFAVLASKSSYRHLANGIISSTPIFFYLMLFIQISADAASWQGKSQACVSIAPFVQGHAPGLGCCHKI